jgi:titin
VQQGTCALFFTVPGAPDGVVAEPGINQATVNWRAPDNGGTAITSYTLTASPGNITATTTGSSSFTITGLKAGATYTFTVFATNAVGNGPASAPSPAITIPTVPAAPTNVVAAAGVDQATVSWSAPNDGGNPITQYTVTASPGNMTATTTGATTAVITGLSGGTTYTFTVTATNAVGTGPASAPSAAITLPAVPGAPTNVVASAGVGLATISWNPPADGGSAISSYTVTASPGGATASTTTATQAVISGLSNGQTYTFTVTATNAVGTGPASTPTSPITLPDVPSAPTNVVASASIGHSTITWTAPADNGSTITGYTVTISPGGTMITTTGATTVTFTGLANGQSYTFSVFATNGVGNGPPASSSVTLPDVPSAPTAVVATAGVRQATVTWTAPGANGSPITSYIVTTSPGGRTATSTGATTAVVTGLSNGTTYTFTVTALNAVGTGTASLPSAPITLPDVPGAPTAVVATAGIGTATVTWTPPSSDGNSPITGYTVSESPGTARVTTAGATTATFTGLTNGQTYTFVVTATNAVGTGAASSASTAITLPTVPDAPTNVLATPGNGQAVISWTVPDTTGGSPITGYTVASTTGSFRVTTTATTATVTGLQNGVSYTFVVYATNAVGNGAVSQPSNAVVPVTIPGAPTSVIAVAGFNEATVSWTAPTSAGGTPITMYTVTASNGASATTTGTTSVVVTGLVNGQTYTFTVTATNAVGTGPASATSVAITLPDVPGAPTGVTATPGNASAMVSWTPPASNGGATITGYTAIASPGGAMVRSTGTTATFPALTNGQSYTFTVFATNSIGNGPASAPSAAITPATVPGAPTGVYASPGNAMATVYWTAPASNGGASITGYTVTVVQTGATFSTTGATSTVVTGLANGTSYTFTVTATNWAGTGPASTASVAITPATVPGVPTGVTATAGDASATVTWTAPTSTGGAPITGYTVTVVQTGATFSTTGPTTTTVTGLTDGATYTFTVYATNEVGNGTPSAPSSPITIPTVPGAPTGVLATAGIRQAMVSWTAPANGGDPITQYTVTVVQTGATFTTTGATTTTVTGLLNGGTYTFTVFATNVVGNGPASTPSTAITLPDVPGAPTGVSAVASAGQATVTWTAPLSTGGLPITGYTVTSSPGSVVVTTTGATSAIVTGLTNGTSYTFTVYATNAVGNGPSSSPSTAVTPLSVPGAPTNVLATAGVGQATVSWTAPVNTGGTTITQYSVTVVQTGAVVTTSGATTATVGGLTPGNSNTFTVTATNSVGTGPASAPSTAITIPTLPGAPTNVVATAGVGQATVSWSAPVNTGGATISSYTVTVVETGATSIVNAGTSTTITGLVAGQSYTFTVAATNIVGTGPASSPSTAITIPTVPGAPTGVSATPGPGGGQATVTWVPPASGGSPITSYTVTVVETGATMQSGVPSATVTGLTPGSSYTFTVFATNAVGNGPPSSASTSITLPTVPGAPTIVMVTGGAGQVTVTWSAPASNGGSPITGYTVTSTPGSFVTSTTGATTATLGGLTNGQSYTFTVFATNAVGNGPASAPSSAVTPLAAPGAPTGVSATAGIGQAMVSWTAPASNGGTPITQYTVTVVQTGATFTTTGATSTTVTGLTAGNSYTFTVFATNSVGDGPASSPSTALTIPTVPGAPTSVSAAPGVGQATVSWTAPPSGGSPITGYTVTVVQTGATFMTTGTSQVITGLTAGSSYTFTVYATNAVGNGPTSSATTAITIPTVPAAPTNVSATAGVGQAMVTWSAPGNGGSAITGYTVTVVQTGTTVTAVGTSATVTGLVAGSSYTFTVTATNAVGTGPASSPSPSITIPTVPGTPTNVTATAGSLQAIISWTPPATGGSAITGYTVTNVQTGATYSTSGTTVAATNLTAGASYTFTVYATNAVGNGVVSGASNSVTIYGAPNLAMSSLTASPTSLTANGTSTTTLTATIKDSSGNLLPGLTVSFSSTGTGNTFSTTSATTTSSGVATSTLKSTVAQVKTVTASVGSISLTVMVTFKFNCSGMVHFNTSTVTVGSHPQNILTADFNGDGFMDLAVANTNSGTVSILLNNQSGGFSNATGSPITVGTSPQGMAVGDFNNDSHMDLAVANYSSQNVNILLGNGSGGFSNASGSPIAVNSELTAIAAGNFGNGEIDLAVASFNNNEVYILAGNGSGGFANASGSPITVGSGPNAILAGYFTGASTIDLAVANAYDNSGGNTVSILLHSGTDTFSAASGSPISVGLAPDGIAMGLFDGNSNVDLAIANGTSGTVSILLGNGSGGFSQAAGSPISVGTSPYSVTDGDFNGDGYLDLAVGLDGAASVAFLLGNGAGAFSAPTNGTVSVGNAPYAITSADFNGDGAPDIATANQTDGTVSILLNQCP